METQTCNTCQETKSIDQFSTNMQRGKLRRFGKCKPCRAEHSKRYRKESKAYADRMERIKEQDTLRKRRNRYKKWGLDPLVVENHLKNHNGKCDLCQEPLVKVGRRGVNVDHCHATSAFRGILCDNCNLGLGHFKDQPRLLLLAIEYLQRDPIS